ncbi:MAG: HD domain-containing protein [Lachnospiraceae bacterium]|nr:HD domain-containing protein [Lachnospiraceae bacterium]
MNKRLLELEKELQSVLKESRFIHTQGVRYTAAALAMCYGQNTIHAQIAGILHDCAKGFSDDELLDICREKQIEISDAEQGVPYLLHAKVGAYLAQEKYEIEEQEVLSGICYHTTGRAGMTPLEQIIFIADYIEPNRREIPGLEECRKLAFEDLDKATYCILENTLLYLKKTKGEGKIDPTTKKAYLYYKEKCK